ncbi:hypothetical protein HD553DRAFT_327044 [Filobasidium floriforme]|uniref:uncharacterized protein n=1 Tax=Filobasidium floriforme TaxID=5210 RepID=UPI001E8E20A9|nr:uncharacterized protein HD553DRAFT_327044 [Filobasidium floriforme]KAH8077964.1 hypothetical protein HD553DRAFT_327044 [Filobasidium floriforme]
MCLAYAYASATEYNTGTVYTPNHCHMGVQVDVVICSGDHGEIFPAIPCGPIPSVWKEHSVMSLPVDYLRNPCMLLLFRLTQAASDATSTPNSLTNLETRNYSGCQLQIRRLSGEGINVKREAANQRGRTVGCMPKPHRGWLQQESSRCHGAAPTAASLTTRTSWLSRFRLTQAGPDATSTPGLHRRESFICVTRVA